jgi:hypothetical protein
MTYLNRKNNPHYKPTRGKSPKKQWLSILEWLILFILAVVALIVALSGKESNNGNRND